MYWVAAEENGIFLKEIRMRTGTVSSMLHECYARYVLLQRGAGISFPLLYVSSFELPRVSYIAVGRIGAGTGRRRFVLSRTGKRYRLLAREKLNQELPFLYF